MCEHCEAIKFMNKNHFKCYQNGKVALPALLQFPSHICELLNSSSAQLKHFRKYITIYKDTFSFASL